MIIFYSYANATLSCLSSTSEDVKLNFRINIYLVQAVLVCNANNPKLNANNPKIKYNWKS